MLDYHNEHCLPITELSMFLILCATMQESVCGMRTVLLLIITAMLKDNEHNTKKVVSDPNFYLH